MAEFCGTFALTFVAAGAEVIGVFSGGKLAHAERVVAPALMVMALIYGIGDVSGAHLNPAVTLCFTVRRAFPIRLVLPYWLAQFAGALVAALTLRALFGDAIAAGVSKAGAGELRALAMEAILSCFLLGVILNASKRHKVIGSNAALAVAATIALCGLFAEPISGASMNPARSLGPAIVAGHLSSSWIYVVGPCLGGLVAVLLTRLVHGPPHEGDREAAEGEGAERDKN